MDLAKIYEKGVVPIYTPEPLLLSEWADRHFYLSAESSSIEGRWESLPYQVAILNWMGNDNIRIIDWQKSARVGYTKCIMASIGYYAEHKKRNQLVYQPTDSDAQDFVKDEINPMIRDVEVVRDMLKCNPEIKSEFNTMEKKGFHGSTLDIKGGKSGRNYRRMTKDVVYYDELDGFDHDIAGEGSPTTLGDVRISTSSFPKSIRGTTPKIKGTSLIEASIEETETVFYRYLPCPDCETMQRLEWERFTFDTGDPSTAGYACQKCGVVVAYDKYPDMDANGRWQTENGIYYVEELDQFFDAEDNLIADPEHIGVKIWSAYSYFMTWKELVSEFLSANREKKKGKLTKMKTFVNTRFGETWEEIGERIDQEFDDRLEEYSPDSLPIGVLYITAGADVQGGKDARIEIEFTGWGIGEESWSIDYLVIPGAPEQQEVWDHLDEELKKVFTREDGVSLFCSCCCIDSGYLPSRVFRFTKPRKNRRIFATKGKAQHSGPLAGKPTWQGDKIRALQYPINTDEAKQTLYTRLEKVEIPGPGYCHFPAHYAQKYFGMLTAEEKRVRFVKGVKRHDWVKIRDRNEALDCRVGSMAALQIANPKLPVVKLRLEREAEQRRHGLPIQQQSRRRVRSSGLR